MLTSSTERFEKIQKESPLECQHYLTQVTQYEAGQNCKVYNIHMLLVNFNCSNLFISIYTDVDRGQADVREAAAGCGAGHALAPIRRSPDHQLQEGLHLRQTGCHETAIRRARTRNMRGTCGMPFDIPQGRH